MGTRQVFRVFNGERKLVASLYSNCSHPNQSAEDIFWDEVDASRNHVGPNALIESLLAKRYRKTAGNHRKGDRIFWLVPAETEHDGDIDSTLEVTHNCASEELATRGAAPIGAQPWSRLIRDGANVVSAQAVNSQ